jgi:heptaprenyl diphosphate synthase
LAAIDGDLSDDAVLADVVSRLREHEVTAEALAEAKRWAQDAIAAIAGLPNGSIKNAFASFAEAVVEREG